MTEDLVTWLREQIAEDRTRAEWLDEDWLIDTGDKRVGRAVRHFAEKSAVLTQCEAHTALLYHADLRARAVRTATLDGGVWDHVLRLLALAYQHRDGYRSEWKP